MNVFTILVPVQYSVHHHQVILVRLEVRLFQSRLFQGLEEVRIISPVALALPYEGD